MAIKESGVFVTQTSITSATAAADATIKLRPDRAANILMDLTAGSPTTGARIEVTISPPDQIDAGTATWVVPNGVGYSLTDTMLTSTTPNGCLLTGVRLSVSDGTWTLGVRQA